MMIRKHTALTALFAAAAAFSLPALAQTQDPPPTAEQDATAADAGSSQNGQSWASVDTDGDGAINKTEATANAGLSQIFDQADSDKDGKLTVEEYKAYVAAQKN